MSFLGSFSAGSPLAPAPAHGDSAACSAQSAPQGHCALPDFQAFLSKEVQLPFRGENYYIGLSAQEVGQWHWVDNTPFIATAA